MDEQKGKAEHILAYPEAALEEAARLSVSCLCQGHAIGFPGTLPRLRTGLLSHCEGEGEKNTPNCKMHMTFLAMGK